ncbi:hypothetical protein DRJ17_04785 [Candidatus Woesearchaeota archaeon]|mgnify:CR=1 FL=1|nr:MAG: hypothetical protein DRJ17_04785 [Candidatus Woesearchaeota archaeon]
MIRDYNVPVSLSCDGSCENCNNFDDDDNIGCCVNLLKVIEGNTDPVPDDVRNIYDDQITYT